MKIACPGCANEIDLRQDACPNCGFSLTLGKVVSHYWKYLCGRVREEAVVQCPKCHKAVPLNEKVCPDPDCATPITVEATLQPVRQQWQGFLNNASPTFIRYFQWCYLFVSALAVWCLLAYVEKHNAENWITHAFLSVLYLVVFAVIVVAVVPRHVLTSVSVRASGRMKFALICNYFAFLMVLQIMISAWLARAMMMAGFFGVTALAVWLFRALFSGQPSDRTFDPSTPQGRRGRYD